MAMLDYRDEEKHHRAVEALEEMRLRLEAATGAKQWWETPMPAEPPETPRIYCRASDCPFPTFQLGHDTCGYSPGSRELSKTEAFTRALDLSKQREIERLRRELESANARIAKLLEDADV